MKTRKNICLTDKAMLIIKKLENKIPKFSFSSECEKLVFELKRKHKIK